MVAGAEDPEPAATQYEEPAMRLVHSALIEGLSDMNPLKLQLFAAATESQVSPDWATTVWLQLD